MTHSSISRPWSERRILLPERRPSSRCNEENAEDIKTVFASISDQLIAEFEKTREIAHGGGRGDAREDALRKVLSDYLPTRYGIGRGEIISTDAGRSGECDIIIYDHLKSPKLMVSDRFSLFPLESVYGVVEVKSVLSSAKLQEAYDSLARARSLCRQGVFQHRPDQVMAVGCEYPKFVTAVVGYSSGRSLDAIAKQVVELDEALEEAENLELRPDFVAVIGEGLVGPDKIRGDFNRFQLPERNSLSRGRRAGRHTLLRLYLQPLSANKE